MLKISLVTHYRTGWLLAWIGIYLSMIVGSLLASFQKFGGTPGLGFYFGGVVASVFLVALLVTQEFLPYR